MQTTSKTKTMSDVFLDLYRKSSNTSFEYIQIIGQYQALLYITISELKNNYPLYSKEQLIEKLELNYEQLKQKFKEANS